MHTFVKVSLVLGAVLGTIYLVRDYVRDGCAPQKPRTASGDTLFQLVFMMQTAQDVLNSDPTIARQSKVGQVVVRA